MKLTKRLLSAATAVCMGALCPPLDTVQGFAEIIPAAVAVRAEDAPTSGTCGEDLTWTLDLSTGTLTISGTGDMTDWNGNPWGDNRELIKNVVIKEGMRTTCVIYLYH